MRFDVEGADLGCAFEGCHVDLRSSGCWVNPSDCRDRRGYGDGANTEPHPCKSAGSGQYRSLDRHKQTQIVERRMFEKLQNELKQRAAHAAGNVLSTTAA